MREALEPLVSVPGVIAAAIITGDGVPVVEPGRSRRAGGAGAGSADVALPETDALAGLAAGWLDELARALAPLSWEAPHGVVLRAARGTLCLRRASGAIVLACLQAGLSVEQIELPMQATCARLERALRRFRRTGPEESTVEEVAPVLPARASQPAGVRDAPTSKRTG